MRLWILLIIVLVAFAGCSSDKIIDSEEIESEPEETEQEIREPEETEQEPAEPKENEANQSAPENQFEPVEEEYSVKKFYELYKAEVQNYKFKFNTDIYKVKDNLVKIELSSVKENIYNAPFVDTVYLDRERKTAIGVCEGRNSNVRKKCTFREVWKKQFAMPYIKFAIKFPDDWLTEFLYLHTVLANRPVLATERPNIHLKYVSTSRKTELFFDPTSGLPMVVSDNNVEYHYKNLARNTVTEKFLIEK